MVTERLGRSPTVDTLLLVGGVYLVQRVMALLGRGITGLLALAPPVGARPWTVVTSVYAHATPGHLLGNAIALLILGLIVERGTTRARFHAFVVATGALGGLAEVYFNLLMGTEVAVLGISGAVFALLGYVLTGNPLAGGAFRRLDLDSDVQLVLLAIIAGVIALVRTPKGAALIGHFTGLFLGLVAGRLRLLRVGEGDGATP